MTNKNLRILILGGYGTFGGRLARLLSDESAVTLLIAGRSLSKARTFCDTLPGDVVCKAAAVDRNLALVPQLSELAPDVVIDASGPFQGYGDDPYRVVKAAIATGCHYLDFADGSDFVRGIAQFDESARNAGLVVLSGVSSFPVLTAAVVRHIAGDLDAIETITGGIAPSPYAGVGLNVVRAIAGYAGQKVAVRRDGRSGHGYAMAETRRYTVATPGHLPLDPLVFSLVDVPDNQLLADLWPEVQSVWMGAAPVPAILHRMLRWLAHLVRLGLIPTLSPLARLMFHTINVLRWGEHRGGMFVEVKGTTANGVRVKRSWHLLAEGDDGPFIPCMALEALIRHWVDGKSPPVGARSAIEELEVADYEPLFRNRQIYHGTRAPNETGDVCLYKRVLGDAWSSLPPSICSLHEASRDSSVQGSATVDRGPGFLANKIADLFGFPSASNKVDASVRFQQVGEREQWTRNFGGRQLKSYQYEGQGRYEGLICEKFGPFVFGLALIARENRLYVVARRWSFLGIPLPRFLIPSGDTYEFEEDGTFHFHVEIKAPILGLVVRYVGELRPE